jgi:hypothetical protein
MTTTAINAPVLPVAVAEGAIASVTCLGSSTYVAHDAADVTATSKKGRATYAIVACPTCHTAIEAGVWYTEKGKDLRDTRGLTYLPRHAAPVLGPVAAPVAD